MEQVYILIEMAVKVIVATLILMGFVAYTTLLERKALGWILVRPGPNRVGPWGLLQPIADGIKSFFKEEIIPDEADKTLYVIAPGICLFTALSMFAVIPFGGTITILGRQVGMVIADIDSGLLYVLALATLGEYGVVLGGWASGNKYGVLGALRAAAQMISYEVALGLAVIGVIILSGSLKLTDIIAAQQGAWYSWYVFKYPFGFIFYLIAGLAEINRTPFDMPESESELACGFNIEYSSMKFATFMIADTLICLLSPCGDHSFPRRLDGTGA
jgi:NADH-quinone oxidoreductase subunit H